MLALIIMDQKEPRTDGVENLPKYLVPDGLREQDNWSPE